MRVFLKCVYWLASDCRLTLVIQLGKQTLRAFATCFRASRKTTGLVSARIRRIPSRTRGSAPSTSILTNLGRESWPASTRSSMETVPMANSVAPGLSLCHTRIAVDGFATEWRPYNLFTVRDEGNEADRVTERNDGLAIKHADALELLGIGRTDGDNHASAFAELSEQGGRHIRSGGGD